MPDVYAMIATADETVQERLAETFRVARDGGRLAVFDGDYATTTVAGHDNDPLPSRGR